MNNCQNSTNGGCCLDINRLIRVLSVTGPTGPQGIAGDTPSITIGTVTTGAPGTDAAATITGTAPNFVLNLTIPQGPTGPSAT